KNVLSFLKKFLLHFSIKERVVSLFDYYKKYIISQDHVVDVRFFNAYDFYRTCVYFILYSSSIYSISGGSCPYMIKYIFKNILDVRLLAVVDYNKKIIKKIESLRNELGASNSIFMIDRSDPYFVKCIKQVKFLKLGLIPMYLAELGYLKYRLFAVLFLNNFN